MDESHAFLGEYIMIDTFFDFPPEIEIDMAKIIRGQLNSNSLEKYIEEPIQDNVLKLLDSLCIVVFYPLEDENNNGFHITDMPFANGNIKNFVFINTAQTTEKQVFTAAHELGHIWNVDKTIIDEKKYSHIFEKMDNEEYITESIINRFAAVLLMPQDTFKQKYSEFIDNYITSGNAILLIDLLKIVIQLMDVFFAPFKSVVFRLYELNLISAELRDLLFGEGEIPLADINNAINKLIADFGLVQFQNPTNKKWIAGFADLLDEAEKKNLVISSKIELMRSLFGLKDNQLPTEMQNIVEIRGQNSNES